MPVDDIKEYKKQYYLDNAAHLKLIIKENLKLRYKNDEIFREKCKAKRREEYKNNEHVKERKKELANLRRLLSKVDKQQKLNLC